MTAHPSWSADAEKLRASDAFWRLATALSGAMTPLEVARALADEGAAAAGASFSNMAMLDADQHHVRAVHHSSAGADVSARWSEFELSTPTPLCEAMSTGLPVLLGSLEAVSRRFPHMRADTMAAHLSATASLPLSTASGQILGAAGFGWSETRTFTLEELRDLDLIAQMAAQALERASLYESKLNQAMSRERADAQLFQDACLPRSLEQRDGLELAARYLPASDAAMGGDWYDVFPVERGTCLVIGDVEGHGLQSAAMMAQLRNTVRAYAIEDPSPARVLNRLNQMMCRLEPGAHASAIVAIWDGASGSILGANAGHPPVLSCRPGEVGYLTPPPRGLLLGVEVDHVYEETSEILQAGTSLLFYTDGLIETRGRQPIGAEELLTFVERCDDCSPQPLCDHLLDWRLQLDRIEDDVCVLAARYIGRDQLGSSSLLSRQRARRSLDQRPI